MESTEKIVSREDEHFPEDVDKILIAIPKCSYPTVDQLIKETSLTAKRLAKALKHLEKSKLIRRRIDPFYGVLYKLVPLETKIPDTKQRTRGDSSKSLEQMAKVKQLYEANKKYREIAEELGVPDYRVAYVCAKLIKLDQVKRRIAQQKTTTPATPTEKRKEPAPSPTQMPEFVNVDVEDKDDDDAEDLEQTQPDVADLLKDLERIAQEIRESGWQIDVQVRLVLGTEIVPIRMKGAS